MRFSEYPLAPELKQNIEALGYQRPTDIQYKAIKPILEGEDVLAVAQTGTGKTAAFAIPIIQLLHQKKSSRRQSGVRALIMVPTHELAIQMTTVFHQLAKHTHVKAYRVFGGVDQDPQIATLNNGVDILIATPGRMFDLHSQGHLNLDTIQILVLDEADQMLALGFRKDIHQLATKLPKRRQTLFFSATIDEEIKELAYGLVKNAIRIQISPDDPVSKNVNHAVCFIAMDDKRFFLERMVKEYPDSKMLVFVRTKVRAERVQQALARAGLVSATIHGDKDQRERQAVMQAFHKGELLVLIATDLTGRGVDIPQVAFVINYDLPEDEEQYVHRIGRTGRGKEHGQAFSFCSEEERPMLRRIEAYLNKPIQVIDIDPKDYQETLHFSDNGPSDWRSLMKEHESEKPYKGKKRR